MQLPDLNPDSISEPATHQVVIQLLNVIDTLAGLFRSFREQAS